MMGDAKTDRGNSPIWLIASVTAGIVGYLMLLGWCTLDLSANRFFDGASFPWRLGPNLPSLYDMTDPANWPVLDLMAAVKEEFPVFDDHGHGLRWATAYFGFGLCVAAAIACSIAAIIEANRARLFSTLAWFTVAGGFLSVVVVAPAVADAALCRSIHAASAEFHDAACQLRDHQLTSFEDRSEWLFLNGFGSVRYFRSEETDLEGYVPRGYARGTKLGILALLRVQPTGVMIFLLGNATYTDLAAVEVDDTAAVAELTKISGEPFFIGDRFAIWITRSN